MKTTTIITAFAAILAANASSAAVPIRWTVETSLVEEKRIEAFHGEKINLEAVMKSYGRPLEMSGKKADLFWQTNGMDRIYWATNAAIVAGNDGSSNVIRAVWSPVMDPGTPTVRGFLGVPGENYRANFIIRFHDSPGATPNVLSSPIARIDFSQVETSNAPWLDETTADGRYATKSELSGKLDEETADGRYATLDAVEEKLDATTAGSIYATKSELAGKMDEETADARYALKGEIADATAANKRDLDDNICHKSSFSKWILHSDNPEVDAYLKDKTLTFDEFSKAWFAPPPPDGWELDIVTSADENSTYVNFRSYYSKMIGFQQYESANIIAERTVAAVSNEIFVTESAVTGKADKATTLKGYGISDARIDDDGTVCLGEKSVTPITAVVNDITDDLSVQGIMTNGIVHVRHLETHPPQATNDHTQINWKNKDTLAIYGKAEIEKDAYVGEGLFVGDGADIYSGDLIVGTGNVIVRDKSAKIMRGDEEIVYGVSIDGGQTFKHGNVILEIPDPSYISGVYQMVERIAETTSNRQEVIEQAISNKQDKLISGETIKTVNGVSVLGTGDIEIIAETLVDDVTQNDVSVVDPKTKTAKIDAYTKTNAVLMAGTVADNAVQRGLDSIANTYLPKGSPDGKINLNYDNYDNAFTLLDSTYGAGFSFSGRTLNVFGAEYDPPEITVNGDQVVYGIQTNGTGTLHGTVDLSPIAEDSRLALAYSKGVYQYMTGSTNAWFEGTNYNVNAEQAESKVKYKPEPWEDVTFTPCSLQLFEIRDGERRCVWDQRDWTVYYWNFKSAQMSNALANATHNLSESVRTNYMRRGWANYTAVNGLDNPNPSTLFVDTEKVSLMAGMQWEKMIELGGHSYYTITANGITISTNDAQSTFLSIKDFEGNACLTFRKTSSYLVWINSEIQSQHYDDQGRVCFTINTDICPTAELSTILEDDSFVEAGEEGCPANHEWTGQPGAWTSHFLLKPGIAARACFARYKVLREGENIVEYSVPVRLNGGISFEQDGVTRKIRPRVSGNTVTWEVVQ